ncbi:MAG: flagellar hook-length control protein FliK [Thermodesulfobacteriota bacterium]
MQSNLIFSEFFQSNMMGSSVKTVNSQKSGESGFDAFLRKFQEGEFDFLKTSGTGASDDLNDLLGSQDSKEKFISQLVERMKEILRQASDDSSFVNFSSAEVTAFRQVMVSAEIISDQELNSLTESMENSSGKYLPDLVEAFEGLNNNKVDTENVHFPFSFVPFFETAMQSINIEHASIKETIESSVDIEKGFSLENFLQSLKGIKAGIEKQLENLEGNNYEKEASKIKGIETIVSVFEADDSEELSFNADRNKLEKFISAMEQKLKPEINNENVYKEALFSSAGKKESDFVASLLTKNSSSINDPLESMKEPLAEINGKNESLFSNKIGGALFEESFSAWKRKERVLSESVTAGIKEDFTMKQFQQSPDYKLYTKLASVELDLENYFSGADKKSEVLVQAKEILKTLESGGKSSFDADILSEKNEFKNQSESKGFGTLLERSVKKNSSHSSTDDFSEDSSDLMEKKGSERLSAKNASADKPKQALHKNIMNQVEKQVLRTVKLGQKELSFQLNPPDLGKMHLKLESVRNGVNIRILAEKGSTHEILLQHAQEFKAQLQNQGMQVVEINVELSSDFDQAMARERRNNSEGKNKGQNSNRGKFNKSEKISEDSSGSGFFKRPSLNSALDLMA